MKSSKQSTLCERVPWRIDQKRMANRYCVVWVDVAKRHCQACAPSSRPKTLERRDSCIPENPKSCALSLSLSLSYETRRRSASQKAARAVFLGELFAAREQLREVRELRLERERAQTRASRRLQKGRELRKPSMKRRRGTTGEVKEPVALREGNAHVAGKAAGSSSVSTSATSWMRRPIDRTASLFTCASRAARHAPVMDAAWRVDKGPWTVPTLSISLPPFHQSHPLSNAPTQNSKNRNCTLVSRQRPDDG